jgi:hypothetical protein
MKRYTAALCVVSSFAANTFAPTQADLDRDLASAAAEWHTETGDTRIEMQDIGPCRVGDIIALRRATVRTSRLVFDDGSSGPEVSAASYVIEINSECRWTELWLQRAVTHEVGHISKGVTDQHSNNPKSIMFRVVYPDAKHPQGILPEDR